VYTAAPQVAQVKPSAATAATDTNFDPFAETPAPAAAATTPFVSLWEDAVRGCNAVTQSPAGAVLLPSTTIVTVLGQSGLPKPTLSGIWKQAKNGVPPMNTCPARSFCWCASSQSTPVDRSQWPAARPRPAEHNHQ